MASSQLPSGTVTFLFTDIEGSTRLIEELGEEPYIEALAEHRRLLREAFSARGGVEVDTQGDAFLYAFAEAGEALVAAAEGQQAQKRRSERARGALRDDPRPVREAKSRVTWTSLATSVSSSKQWEDGVTPMQDDAGRKPSPQTSAPTPPAQRSQQPRFYTRFAPK